MKEILKFIKEQLKQAVKHIKERGAIYSSVPTYEEEHLFDLDMDKYPVSEYDREELENHAYDLGRYYAFKEALEYLEKEDDNSYILVPWPDFQSFMEEDWFYDEAIVKLGDNAYFIPKKRIQ